MNQNMDCGLFVNLMINLGDLRELINKLDLFPKGIVADVTVTRNSDAYAGDLDGENGFLYYPFEIAIDFHDAQEKEEYKSEINRLVKSLRKDGANVVVVSDFESELD